MITRNWRAEALAEGLTVDRGTLATVVLGGRICSAVEAFDSFADSAFSFNIFALFERGISSSSSELNKRKVSKGNRNEIQAKMSQMILTI
jgi:hypothetical protein